MHAITYVLVVVSVLCSYTLGSTIENLIKTEGGNTITSAQRKKLDSFRLLVSKYLEDDYERSDEYLFGYLEHRKWRLNSAEQMLKLAKNWKKMHSITELAKADFPEEMMKHFPVRIKGHDKNGCVFIEANFGDWDIANYIQSQEFVRDGVKSMVKFGWQMQAKLELALRNSYPKCQQARVICNLQNFTMDHVSEVNTMGAIIKIVTTYLNYYPNMVSVANYVEVPESFKLFVDLITPYVNDFEFHKLVLHYQGNEDWKEMLDAIIEPDQRITSLGGTAELV